MFQAGAHIDVHTPSGAIRQYSLCNPNDEGRFYRIAVLREQGGRGGSVSMHDQLHEQSALQISAPRNFFPLNERAHKTFLLAGGIGITPLLAMAERLTSLGAAYELHYCTRSRARAAFADELQRGPFADKVILHHDDDPGLRLNLQSVLHQPVPGAHLYVCGPAGFMDAAIGTAREQGWHGQQIHYEYFASAPVHAEGDQAFEIQLMSSGKVIEVSPSQTAVEALAANGVRVPTSCEQGICGTCMTRVIEGEVDHRDFHLSPKEQALNDRFMPCCSRAKSKRLVLAL